MGNIIKIISRIVLISAFFITAAVTVVAQNVGIGTITPHPSAILDVQAVNKGLRLPNLTTVQRNSIINPANGLLVFDTDLRQLVYHANGRWLGVDSTASLWTKAIAGKLTSVLPNVNINTSIPDNLFTLAMSGPAIILNGSDNTIRSSAYFTIADTLLSRTSTTGITIQKYQPGGNHFMDLFLNGTKSRGGFGVNFKNGSPAEKNPQIILDSSGNVGIGQSIEQDSVLLGQLHVFGSQRIQGVGGARLTLHGETGNFAKRSEITFQQNPTGISEAIRSARYFMRLNGTEADTENEKTTFALGYFLGGIGPLPSTSEVGFTQNRAGQVGIRRYPEKTLTSIDVDISGFTRINGGIQFEGIGEAAGKLLISSANGSATWQNPEKITLDQPATTGLSSLEFRNNGTYRGAMGWSQTDGRFFMFDGESGQNVFFINNGRFGIRRDATTNALEVGGDASKSTAGSWLGNSDARLKKNMMPIASALNKLLQLKGITYEWNDNSTGYTRPNGTQFGFTAQNVQQVFPTMVSSDAQGYLQTAYGTYDPLIVEAIRELKVENEQLKKEIEAIKALLLKK